MKRRRKRQSLLLLVLIGAVGMWFPSGAAQSGAASKRNIQLEQRLKESVAQSGGVWGVSVKHVERNEFAAINADQKFQLASVFKIPVLVELFNQAQEGKVSLTERIEWKDPERYFGSGILVTLKPGLRPTLRDLATLMIIVSDNAATDTVCERLGFDNINARLRSLGLTRTSVEMGTRDLILQALGLPGEEYKNLTSKTLKEFDWKGKAAEIEASRKQFLEQCPDCGTPEEITLLLEKILAGQAADEKGTEQILEVLSQQQFNQRLPRWIPYGQRVDHKTGTLTLPVWVVNDAGILYTSQR